MAFSAGNVAMAVEHYTQGLMVARRLPNNERQIVALLTNRTQAFYRQGQYDEALEDAQLSVEYDPSWSKVMLAWR